MSITSLTIGRVYAVYLKIEPAFHADSGFLIEEDSQNYYIKRSDYDKVISFPKVIYYLKASR